MSESKLKILALCGSLRKQSVTLKALRVAAEGIEEAGAECILLHGDEMNLPLCGAPPNASVERLRQLALHCDGFLLGSPEYHGGMSGVLKNAMDLLNFDHFAGKPVAAVSVAGGNTGVNTLNAIRISARWVHAWVIPEQVTIGGSKNAFDEDDRPLKPNIEERLHALGQSLVQAAEMLNR